MSASRLDGSKLANDDNDNKFPVPPPEPLEGGTIHHFGESKRPRPEPKPKPKPKKGGPDDGLTTLLGVATPKE